MNRSSALSSVLHPLRIAALAVALCATAAFPGHAGDALTTGSSTTTSTRTSLLSSLLGIKSSSSSSSSTSSTFSDRVNRSILGLPLGLLKSAASLGNKSVSNYVSKHIKSN